MRGDFLFQQEYCELCCSPVYAYDDAEPINQFSTLGDNICEFKCSNTECENSSGETLINEEPSWTVSKEEAKVIIRKNKINNIVND